MSTLTILRGLPASGKTTFAKQWVSESPTTRAHSNRDDLRASLFGAEGVLPFADEQVITTVQQATVNALLAVGKDVIVDDTNLRVKFARAWADLATQVGAEFVVNDDFLKVSVDECVERDEVRYIRGGRQVGEDVIRSIAQKFHNVLAGKESVVATPVLDATDSYRHVPDVSLPSAVMVDIDGTVALLAERGPYDFTKYHTDAVNEPIAALVRDLYVSGERIIYCSGRDDTYRAETQAWLEDKGLWWGGKNTELHMRPNAKEPQKGNKRNDAIVKVELFREHIGPRFNVRFVLDDRDRVIKAWRSIGLTALQVADGDF